MIIFELKTEIIIREKGKTPVSVYSKHSVDIIAKTLSMSLTKQDTHVGFKTLENNVIFITREVLNNSEIEVKPFKVNK